ncbi:hypothetical protein PFICI_10575 [Pestalotiopsis fici W106-1]|uniref:C3H1-type domain-containing protein n=1 Tax=Pestalotiopsis fici (strain W106-1 / CGMCC3.15140) TaxID=1229662 RepID=W3WXA7_PESFW|nr:uncharacterized protein PFICI_10575 [Pestalotiopsis fici W106-1]ETS78513.1 hypothetical protein PFICI_10575 [Pestalotiopsis fici W106-1]
MEQGRSSQPAIAQAAPTRSKDALEEGELSEGELEDIYDPKGPHVVSHPPTQQTQPSGANDQATGSPGDADGSSIYDTGSAQEDMVIDSTSASQPGFDEDDDYEPGEYEPEYHPREKSGSYSPRLSPKEARSAVPAGTHAASNGQGTATEPEYLNGQKSLNESRKAPSSINQKMTPTSPSPPYKSLSEAKKKAQEAILGLWPFKVRYQDYLDEGLDPQTVKSLFKELGLDASSPKPATVSAISTTKPPIPQLADSAQSQSSTKASALPPALSDQAKPAANLASTGQEPKTEQKKSAQEERKDKIARMLAEKSKKTAAQPPPAVVSSPTVPSPKVPPAAIPATSSEITEAAKSKLRAQNNQKLLEKLAALKKQQGTKPEPGQQPSTPVAPVNKSELPVVSTSTATSAKQSVDPKPPVVEPDASSASGGQVHSVSSSPHPAPTSRNMKRPIASDFDGYSSTSSAFKRNRTQETLIIDVSDDEDVEMDLGSPTEPSSSAIQDSISGLRTNVLASHPPLTHSRSWHGPKSNSATPAAQTPSGHGQKLDLLTQQIQEARRRIAEAEAKKASRSNGEPTPLAQSPANTPDPQAPALAKPPQTAQGERRDRITAYHIPVLDAALREKQERLRRLQEEAAQLEIEVKATLDARQQLTIEMDSPDIAKPTSPQLNGSLEAFPQVAAPEPAHTGEAHVAAVVPEPNPTEVSSNIDSKVSSGKDGSAASSPNNTSMEIESDSASSGRVTATAIVTAEMPSQVDLPSVATSPPGPEPAESPTRQESASLSVGVVVDAEPQDQSTTAVLGDVPQEQPSTELDVPMQISDAEDEDYEPQPPHISDTVQAYGTSGTADEVIPTHIVRKPVLIQEQIPDEEPYEPSPSQVAEPTTQTASNATNATAGDAQSRSGKEHPLLTTEQAKSQNELSAKDLLSYQSPLRYFHAYKFHPQYMENVAGGLKSMTYSSKIDTSRPICPFVLDGGQCPKGPDCEFQHFEKMVLSEPAIIAELGSTATYTGEQKDRFIEGLKKVLQDLKTRKIKDFESITKALMDYRADFLGDKSKILPLNDIVI